MGNGCGINCNIKKFVDTTQKLHLMRINHLKLKDILMITPEKVRKTSKLVVNYGDQGTFH